MSLHQGSHLAGPFTRTVYNLLGIHPDGQDGVPRSEAIVYLKHVFKLNQDTIAEGDIPEGLPILTEDLEQVPLDAGFEPEEDPPCKPPG